MARCMHRIESWHAGAANDALYPPSRSPSPFTPCWQACGVRFRAYRLLPKGSYPQVVDVRGNQTHDLFGPVNKFLCQSYDKAQVGFLVSRGEWVGGAGLPATCRLSASMHTGGHALPARCWMAMCYQGMS